MPIYSYKCKNCGKVFERFQKAGRNTTEYCDDCNSEAHRIFSPVGIIFKGSGFYSTDYKSGSNKSINNAASDKEDKKESKVEKESKVDDKKTGDIKSEKSFELKGKNTTAGEKVKT